MNNPIVSLCMPTNGVAEWVFPVLDSIYNQGCDNNLFEIVLLIMVRMKSLKRGSKSMSDCTQILSTSKQKHFHLSTRLSLIKELAVNLLNLLITEPF